MMSENTEWKTLLMPVDLSVLNKREQPAPRLSEEKVKALLEEILGYKMVETMAKTWEWGINPYHNEETVFDRWGYFLKPDYWITALPSRGGGGSVFIPPQIYIQSLVIRTVCFTETTPKGFSWAVAQIDYIVAEIGWKELATMAWAKVKPDPKVATTEAQIELVRTLSEMLGDDYARKLVAAGHFEDDMLCITDYFIYKSVKTVVIFKTDEVLDWSSGLFAFHSLETLGEAIEKIEKVHAVEKQRYALMVGALKRLVNDHE